MANNIRWNNVNRKIHYWGAIICSLPLLIVIVTGIILIFKKDISWIQPQTHSTNSLIPLVTFEKIMQELKNDSRIKVTNWRDIDRLDIRPNKGIIKVRLRDGNIEVQMDQENAKIIHIAIRRSDVIESIHDGSIFGVYSKKIVFFISALILLVLWITGIYLFVKVTIQKNKVKREKLILAK